MKKIIRGKKYNFYIVSEGKEFFIKAKCLSSGRYSCINNLNSILSELKIAQNDFRYFDSKWITKRSSEFYRKASDFLSSEAYRDYLESKLDEDRFYGEWENR